MKAFPNKTGYDNAGRGMDLRDYFAAKAMQAMINKMIELDQPPYEMAKDAYIIADVMMVAKEQE